MEFNIQRTKVRLSFSFFAIIILFLIKDTRQILLYSLISSLLHECVHIIFLRMYRCRIDEISFSLFGGNITRNFNDKSTPIKEMLIHISAPIFNLILGTVIIAFDHSNLVGLINLLIGAFNIIPFYNFDGGNALYHFLTNYIDNIKAECVITVTSCVFIALFTTFNLLVSLINGINISFIIINIYFVSVFVYKLFRKSSYCV